jgi:hypothetical protein
MGRTTVALDDRLLTRVKEKAHREGRTLQDCLNELIAAGLVQQQSSSPTRDREFPAFELGEPLVDLADREALYDQMEDR